MGSSNNFALVIFDCDGVLVESEPLVNRLYCEALAEYGHALDYDECLAEFTGAAMKTRLDAFRERLGWIPPEDFAPRFRQRLHEAMERNLHAVPGIYEVLSNLQVPCCVASNGTPTEIAFRLKLCGLDHFFGGKIFSGTTVARPKPYPDVYLAAAADFDVDPGRCAVVEDSLPGVRAAISAGMTVFGYANAANAAELAELGAVTFSAMHELPALLAGRRRD